MEYKNVSSPRELVYCHFCERDVTRRVYLCCEVCRCAQICVECFANGSENAKHKRAHPYRVISKLDMALFEEEWSGYEELILLQALESVGYGNWEEARNILRSKTAEQIELHFKLCYEPFLGRGLPLEARRAEIAAARAAGTPTTLLQRKMLEMGGVLSAARERAARAGVGGEKGGAVFGDVLGYMPLREEFDIEYDNDFELYLAEMEFGEEDSEEELKTKYSILEIYHKTLAEREKRKRFVIEHELLDLKAQLQLEKGLAPLERQIRSTLKPFLRFMSRAEHEELVADLCREADMRQSLEVLLAGQQAGIRTLEELEGCVFNEARDLPVEQRLLELSQLRGCAQPLNSLEKRSLRKRSSGLEANGLRGGEEADAVFKDANNLLYSQRQLCERLGLGIKEFLLVKEFVIRLAFRNGSVSRREAGASVQIDAEKFDKIFDFFVNNDVIIEDISQ